ncbi:SH3 domain-containing protein [Phormidium tenue FACHB-886]|nr:SH3 domain-containing protein [Phormidium tenue FACHB-886]
MNRQLSLSLLIALSVSACTSAPADRSSVTSNSPAAEHASAQPVPAQSPQRSPEQNLPEQNSPEQPSAQQPPAPTTPAEKLQALNAIATQAEKCVTVIDDPNPPSNVRSVPVVQAGNIVGKLHNFSVVEVVDHQNDWLKVRSPIQGWVSLNLTRATCGTGFQPVLKRINALSDQALAGDRSATDLLVRYSFQSADGAAAETAFSKLGQLAQQQPERLIAVLNVQPEAGRTKLLESLNLLSLTPEGRRAFEAALAQRSDTPTAKTWRLVKQL